MTLITTAPFKMPLKHKTVKQDFSVFYNSKIVKWNLNASFLLKNSPKPQSRRKTIHRNYQLGEQSPVLHKRPNQIPDWLAFFEPVSTFSVYLAWFQLQLKKRSLKKNISEVVWAPRQKY